MLVSRAAPAAGSASFTKALAVEVYLRTTRQVRL